MHHSLCKVWQNNKRLTSKAEVISGENCICEDLSNETLGGLMNSLVEAIIRPFSRWNLMTILSSDTMKERSAMSSSAAFDDSLLKRSTIFCEKTVKKMKMFICGQFKESWILDKKHLYVKDLIKNRYKFLEHGIDVQIAMVQKRNDGLVYQTTFFIVL